MPETTSLIPVRRTGGAPIDIRGAARTLTWSRVRTLLLVAEVLSPSTARNDRFLKRLRYREAGVPLYWVVDGDARAVEVWTPADDFPP
jgi:Uma2 family endonuclease